MEPLSRFGSFCLIMNGVVGAGVLVIPRVFQRAGVGLSLGLLVVVAAVCWFMQVELLVLVDKLTQHRQAQEASKTLLLPAAHQYQWDISEIVGALLGRG